MTWLSRLLSQSKSFQPGITRSRKQALKLHRRLSTLEKLEDRTLLSNVSTSISGYNLTITGDTFNDNFKIIETRQADGTHVTLQSGDLATKINGTPNATWTSPVKIDNIVIKLPGLASRADLDTISFTGDGKSVTETTRNVSIQVTGKTQLQLNMSGVHNAGSLSITSSGQLGTSAAVPLVVDSSQFTAISVTQNSGCCPAFVTLSNDTTSGAVTVKEGWGDNSNITLTNDTFGATTLSQYNGTSMGANCTGANDSINVSNSQLLNLTVHQDGGNGVNNSVSVDTVKVFSNSTGVSIYQGNGDHDTATVNKVSTYGSPNARPTAAIYVKQGNGNNDSAKVTNSTVWGSVTVIQGYGNNDTALVDTVTSNLGGISVTQGSGKQDSATVSNSKAKLDVTVKQGDGELDSATVVNVTAGGAISVTQGKALPSGTDPHGGDTASISKSTAGGNVSIVQQDTSSSSPHNSAAIDNVTSTGGSIWITQGSAAGDSATVANSTAYYNISISQGGGAGDSAIIDNVTSQYGSISVSQGGGSGDSAQVLNSTAYYDVSVGQGDGDGDSVVVDGVTSLYGSINVSQGNGDGDSATVSNSTVAVDINISQLNGNGDFVGLYGVTAGSVDWSEGWPQDIDGDVNISQGDGYNDTVDVDSSDTGIPNTINNLYISQGNSVPFDGCTPGLGDVVHVNDSNITSDLIISQGTDADLAALSTVTIGDLSAVVVGGQTEITQLGGGNTVILGGASGQGSGVDDFETTWLDIFTGSFGGAFVQSMNTAAWAGSFYGNDYTISEDLADDVTGGNTFIDLDGNINVVPSTNWLTD
jgi:hypothetical protein